MLQSVVVTATKEVASLCLLATLRYDTQGITGKGNPIYLNTFSVELQSSLELSFRPRLPTLSAKTTDPDSQTSYQMILRRMHYGSELFELFPVHCSAI